MKNIKTHQPDRTGWCVCRFYNGRFGGFFSRKLMSEDGKVSFVITDIHVFTKVDGYREKMSKDDITEWKYCDEIFSK